MNLKTFSKAQNICPESFPNFRQLEYYELKFNFVEFSIICFETNDLNSKIKGEMAIIQFQNFSQNWQYILF